MSELGNEAGSGSDSAVGARLRVLERRVRERERELSRIREKLNLRTLQLEQTEAALWQLSTLFNEVSIPIMLLDREGAITDLNDEAETLLQRGRDELLGKPLTELLPPERHDVADSLLAACLTGETIRNAAGQLWNLETNLRSARTKLFPLRDQHQEVIGMALAEDVRELKDTGHLLEDVNRELRELALIDGLTQLANRRHFERVYEQELHRAARASESLAVAMVDIDWFKNFNDRLGHAAGDACLRAVSNALSSCLRRPADLIARYGGEEFVALMPATAHEGAVALAEQMCERVEALSIDHPDSETGPFVTVSVGVASAQFPTGVLTDLRRTADEALYAAKRSGRNRVRAVSLTQHEPNAGTAT